jgi:hypothetical protein
MMNGSRMCGIYTQWNFTQPWRRMIRLSVVARMIPGRSNAGHTRKLIIYWNGSKEL